MNCVKCCNCGKFISNSDLNSSKLKVEEIWSQEPLYGLDDVVFYCLKCTEKEQEDTKWPSSKRMGRSDEHQV